MQIFEQANDKRLRKYQGYIFEWIDKEAYKPEL